MQITVRCSRFAADVAVFLTCALPVSLALAGYFPLLFNEANQGNARLLGLGAAAFAGVEGILHRREFRGRRWRPLWWAWCLCILLVFGGVTILIATHATDMLKQMTSLRAAARSALGQRVVEIDLNYRNAAFQAFLDLVAFTCSAFLLGLVRPSKAANFRWFQLHLAALVTLLGRPGAGLLDGYLVTTGYVSPYGPGRLLVLPAMPVIGVLSLLLLFLTLGGVLAAFVFVFVTLPLKLYDFIDRFLQQAHIRAQKKAALDTLITRFDAWLRRDELPFLPDESRGARFALPEEVAHEQRGEGFAFGHLGGRPLFLDTDKHVLLMASTRSGKGVNVIIPHLLRHRGSAFVLDPKGENARATGALREQVNHSVHYLDPFGISGKPQSRFNPLAGFDEGNMEAGSKALAAALIIDQKRDHWTASGQQLVAALILHVVTSEQYPAEAKDLVTVRRLLLGAIKPTLEEMQTNEAAGGLVADLAASFLNTPEKEFGSIVSTAQRETEILDNPYIAACLAAAGEGPVVDFEAWHRGTMTVFLCLSAPKFPVVNRWLRLVLTSALDTMTDRLIPPPMPVCFMLDELATLGHLGVIENAVGLSAGYGIQLVAVFQDIAQMKDLYKGRWASFIGNAGVRVLFNLDDYDSARYWSDFLGRHIVATRSEAQDIYGLTKAQTAGETQRPLLSPEEIMLRYANGRMLVLKQGLRPIEAERVPYWEDQSLAGLWEDPRAQIHHLSAPAGDPDPGWPLAPAAAG